MNKPKEKPKTPREIAFMKDKFGLPLNPALKAKSPKKYGALSQH